MARRSKCPCLASARLLQSIAEGENDSEDDFLPMQRPTDKPDLSAASDRLSHAVRRGLKVISGCRSQSARPRELTDRFPFLERSNPKRLRKGRATAWKTVPCCLRGPSASQVPSKTEMDTFCRPGLGSLWFTRDEDPLELELITASELLNTKEHSLPVLQGRWLGE